MGRQAVAAPCLSGAIRMTVFLGVEASLTGRRWTGPAAEADRLAEAMVQQTRLPAAARARYSSRAGWHPKRRRAFSIPRSATFCPIRVASRTWKGLPRDFWRR